MALWQFDCYIIPRMNCDCVIDLEANDNILSWNKNDISSGKVDFLEKRKSWTEDIVQYGKEDETCLQFCSVDSSTEQIYCRLDLRSLTKKTLRDILNYIKEIDGMILCENKIYPPNIDEIVEVMKKSKASRFCQNPIKYCAGNPSHYIDPSGHIFEFAFDAQVVRNGTQINLPVE